MLTHNETSGRQRSSQVLSQSIFDSYSSGVDCQITVTYVCLTGGQFFAFLWQEKPAGGCDKLFLVGIRASVIIKLPQLMTYEVAALSGNHLLRTF
jgi:hypothetical protein